MIWEITSACDLRCLHCEGDAGRRHPDELDPDEALRLCDEIVAAGCQVCNVSGGEPLVRRDWPRLCERLAAGGVRVVLVSNGSRLDRATAATAASAGVRGVALSVDGLPATHDRIRPAPPRAPRSSSAAVAAALEALAGGPLTVSAITHVSRWNLAELEAVHAVLGAAGVRRWQVQVALPLGRLRALPEPYLLSPEGLVELADRLVALVRGGRPPVIDVSDTIGWYTWREPILRRQADGVTPAVWTGCYAGVLHAGIESNGDVKGCAALPREFVAGNVRERPLAEIWADEERFAYNTRWRADRLTGACAACAYRRVCRAGCTALAWSMTGTIYENPGCLHRIELEAGRASPCARAR